MLIEIITLFPEMFEGPLSVSMIKRAQQKRLVRINVHDLRKWALDKHKTVDEPPYGGGAGMVLKVEPVYRAVTELQKKYLSRHKDNTSHVILTTPQGRPFNFRIAGKLAALNHLVFICGHYDAEDNRVYEHIAEERLSIGDYILTGGELPCMVIIDAVTRLVPGVLGKEESKMDESFSFGQKGLLKYPQYTRPEEFQGWRVPKVLLSGNHKEIENWRKEQALERTKQNRPDLLDK